MANDEVPETHVLAIASHVTSGYVGNTMATFCMQTLGCEVSAIHTVNYSNHVAYKRVTGRKTPADEVAELYRGLKDAGLNNFDVLLSGYCPSAETVEQVGIIARERKLEASNHPGSFFWLLDPVMGDNGQIYVAEDTVPAYKSLLRDADLILPNQFEAELLSDVKIRDLASMKQAIRKLHQAHQVPHVMVTSIRLPPTRASTPQVDKEHPAAMAKLSVVGSSANSKSEPRLFRITVPALPVFFSGTGDMFSATLVARLREAAQDAGLLETDHWQSPDDVAGPDLPLAKATEKVLASMHVILKDTAAHYDAKAKEWQENLQNQLQHGTGQEANEEKEMERHLKLTRAAEVRVVRNAQVLRHPPDLQDFKAQPVDVETGDDDDDAHLNAVTDDLGVLKVADGQGAVHQT